MYFIGLGIAVVCGIIAFAVKDFPPALSWGGVAFGVVFVLWERLPLDPRAMLTISSPSVSGDPFYECQYLSHHR